jgi:transcriptional regulator with XRE-family HTH domain
MQALFENRRYIVTMTTHSHGQRLTALREAAGLSVRELARQVDINHSTIIFWEKNNLLPRSEVLLSMAQALGVSVEQLLGSAPPKARPGSRARQAFESVADLPRRQQTKILDVVEAFVAQQAAEVASS